MQRSGNKSPRPSSSSSYTASGAARPTSTLPQSDGGAGQPGSRRSYVEVTGVSKAFAHRGVSVLVLDDVDVTIEEGELCCIVGPSGCGKSSLLRIIDGLVSPDSGSVRVNGRPVTGPSLDVGFVFQQFNLLPWRTVLRNVLFGLENLKLSKSECHERARRWISLVGLSGFEEHYPRQLSGGMQQRVSLARSMAPEPSLVLMDEPFGSLDALTRLHLQEEMLRIWEEYGRTIVFVTHDIEEAIFLADRVLVMSSAPARIVQLLDIPFPRPRADSIRSAPEFGRLKEELWGTLKQAYGRNGGEEGSRSGAD